MSTSVVANRIYQRGRLVAEDFIDLAPDDLLVRGLRRRTREKEGGLYLADAGAVGEVTATVTTPLRACVSFEVAKLPGEMSRGNPLNLAVGDVVVCRNALVDPLFGDELGLTNLYMGVVGVLERAS